MKKIGIITHYYGSQNYGGLLQAYALCKKLNSMGGHAEQIQYSCENKTFLERQWNMKRVLNIIKSRLFFVANKKFFDNMRVRAQMFANFRNLIPHSKQVYFHDTIANTNLIYDCFITGSDQVWNMDWYDEAYFLKFVEGKPKYAYAASIGTNKLTEERKRIFKENLRGYTGISVREKDTIQLLQPLSNIRIQSVLDPTLLLDKKEWDKICKPRKFNDTYLFCYFLGDDKTERDLAREYAEKHNLKIVTLPFLGGQKRSCDLKFGDIKLYDVCPAGFISLIKYSDCIFTDSFHACVFANIYEKNFYVFERAGFANMSNRISSLTNMFGNNQRFCNVPERQNFKYLDKIRELGSDKSNFNVELKKSNVFLQKLINNDLSIK